MQNIVNPRKRKNDSEFVAGNFSDASAKCLKSSKKSRQNRKLGLSSSASKRLPSVSKRQQRFSKRLLATTTGIKDSVRSTVTLPRYRTSSKTKLRNGSLSTKQTNDHTSFTRDSLLSHLDDVLESVAHHGSITPPVPCGNNKNRRSHKRKQSCPHRASSESRLPLELRRLDIAMVTHPSNGENNESQWQDSSTESDDLANCKVVVKCLSSGSGIHKCRLRKRWKDRRKAANVIRHSLFVREEKLTNGFNGENINGKIVKPHDLRNQASLQHSKSIVKLAASTKSIDVDRCKVKLFDCSIAESTKRSSLSLETKRKQPRSAIKRVESVCSAVEASSSQTRPSLFAALHVDVSNNCENFITSPRSPLPDSMRLRDELQLLESPTPVNVE